MEGSIIANRYVINGVIGSGGMAIVYRGYDRETGEEVAVKVLRSEFMQDEAYVRRFEKESQIAIKYSHKNIVRTIEVGNKDGRHYIVMEYVSGTTLKEYISRNGRLQPQETVRIGRQICDALFYAHSHQLIHRDIKPQNILLSTDGVVKVADFGIAKAPETSTVTISGSNVLGSVHYISPEQARGGITDEKTDIYSIGIVLYEMVTGGVPFTGDTPVAVALKHLQDAPRPPREFVPDIPKALELVILKAISKEQSCRYDNAREMARDLERSIVEPDGSYVKIKQPSADEVEGTRPMHPIKPDNVVPMYSTYTVSTTGPRRPVATRSENSWRKKRGPSAIGILLAVLAGIVLLGGAYLGFRALMDGTIKTQKMPGFIGQDGDTAEKQLIKMNMNLQVRKDPQESDTVEKGKVIDQDPKEGRDISEGGTVVLVISTGKPPVQVPNVTNMMRDDAEAKLHEEGFDHVDVRTETESGKPKGTVVKQDPQNPTELQTDMTVTIWVSQPNNLSDKKIPYLIGKPKEDAVNILTSLGIDINKIDIKPKNSDYLNNVVADQKPGENTPIDANTTVTLYVSNGVPEYKKDVSIEFTVDEDNTDVKVVYLDGDKETIITQKTYNKGPVSITYTATSLTQGEKWIVIYFNGKEEHKQKVTLP